MKTAKELEAMFGITADRIFEIDERASQGILEGAAVRTVTGAGQPPLYSEPMQHGYADDGAWASGMPGVRLVNAEELEG